jgi:hypothetical protein
MAMIRSAPSRLAASTPQRPDGAVADHDHGPAGTGLGREGGVVAGGHNVGEGQQAGAEGVVGIGDARDLDEGGVGERDPDGLALTAVDRVPGVVLAAPAGQVVAGHGNAVDALRALAAADHKRRDDQVAHGQLGHRVADAFHQADEFVPDRGRLVGGFDPAVRPQV